MSTLHIVHLFFNKVYYFCNQFEIKQSIMMKKKIIHFFKIYFSFIALFMLGKPIFMLYYHSLFAQNDLNDYFRVIYNGLPLDASVAGYLTVIPGLLLIASIWVNPKVIHRFFYGYYILLSILLALVYVSDLVLYQYWGFRLDSTPLFYIDKPLLMFASVEWYQLLLYLFFLLFSMVAFYLFFTRCLLQNLPREKSNSPYKSAFVQFLLTALLFLPIRGGFSVSVMNLGKAYFSEQMILNHAAINPCFSLFESLSKGERYDKQYRFMKGLEVKRLFAKMVDVAPTDSIQSLFTVPRPNVIIVVLESFMSRDIASLGGIPGVAPNLTQAGDQGILFTNFYANSFRTDRGLVAVLSGYPAQPTTSIMKNTKMAQSLPSIPKSLKKVGYNLKYYYGGDADFTNMRAYLISQGFERIVSDKDFPLSEKMSKWGAPDGFLFQKVEEDLEGNLKQPFCKVIQTSSSHEPFDVPTHRFKHPYLNAVNYTDSCLGVFFKVFRKSKYWKNTIIVFSPDHAYRYPDGLNNQSVDRYKIPLIIWGGAVRKPLRISTYGGQIDIAATLLYQLRVPHRDFTFSKNILNPASPHFGFFDAPDFMGMVTSDNQIVYDNQIKRVVSDAGIHKGKNLKPAQAFLQTLYDDLSCR